MKVASLVLALAAIPRTTAAPAEHEVKSLPGWDGDLPSKHYSGYIPVGTTSGTPGYIHYWLIMSERDPVNDPLVYWTNGGPGGSGINAGLLTEMGQMNVNENSFSNSTDEIKLFYNPYSWSQVANTVYVSQPKGVGYSYCDESVAEEDCQNDDKTSAEDAYDFFVAFFELYPELKPNDFYLTAESYGGIYIPTFMREIDTRGGIDNFKGAAIGDGCWGTDVGLCAFGTGKSNEIQAQFFQGHSMIDAPLFNQLQNDCVETSTGEWYDESVAPEACKTSLDLMNSQVGTFDIYNVYDTCVDDYAGDDQRAVHESKKKTNRQWREEIFGARGVSTVGKAPLGAALNDFPCGGDAAASAWLAQPSVADALHVNLTFAAKGMGYTWGPSDFSGDLRPLYAELLQKYRMMIYSGDTDACVPFWGTSEWVRELQIDGKPIAEKEGLGWRSWNSPLTTGATEQRAGYVIDYDVNDFRFVTVQGAGHMVPTYKPLFALTMISKFLSNDEF